jgi:hypothetical protein
MDKQLKDRLAAPPDEGKQLKINLQHHYMWTSSSGSSCSTTTGEQAAQGSFRSIATFEQAAQGSFRSIATFEQAAQGSFRSIPTFEQAAQGSFRSIPTFEQAAQESTYSTTPGGQAVQRSSCSTSTCEQAAQGHPASPPHLDKSSRVILQHHRILIAPKNSTCKVSKHLAQLYLIYMAKLILIGHNLSSVLLLCGIDLVSTHFCRDNYG